MKHIFTLTITHPNAKIKGVLLEVVCTEGTLFGNLLQSDVTLNATVKNTTFT